MQDKQLWLHPDYYEGFKCKCGACRNCCCNGWDIAVGMEEYFRLIGMECPEEIHRRLECAFRVPREPSPERYRLISPNWLGECPLRAEDGLCMIQRDLGEAVLPEICRMYPRCLKREGSLQEAVCSNSCEAVAEMLLRPEPLTFRPTPLTVTPPPEGPRAVLFETAGREQEIRLWLIARVQDRRCPLPRRLLALGGALHAMDDALTARDARRVDRLLSGQEDYKLPVPAQPDPDTLRFGLGVMEKLLTVVDEGSRSIRSYGEAVLAYFGQGEEAFHRYEAAREHWERIMPLWPCWMENLLANHMFFTRFPFQDRPVSLRDEYTALCAVYTLLRFLWVGWMADKEDTSAAVDVTAAAFRLIDHTEFDRYAVPVLKGLGCDRWDSLARLLCL